MGIAFEVSADAESAFAHRLADLIKKTIKKDIGAIPDKDSSSWYEHIVSSNADGEVCTEAFVLVIAPNGRHGEGQDKWDAISEFVRSLLSNGEEVRPLERGYSRAYSNPLEKNITFPSLDETVPQNRTSQLPNRRNT